MPIRSRAFRRGVCAALALCAMAPMLGAQRELPTEQRREHPTPMPLFAAEWGMSVDTLMLRAANAGWEFIAVDEDGDYTFRGQLPGGEHAYVFATVDSGGLTRVLVSVSPRPDAELTFERLADTLRAHFGAAAVSTEDGEARPAPHMVAATAWRGILMGLRRDRRILILFTCPASSPKLPARHSAFTVV